MSFLVGTSQYIISGVLDKISLSLNISVASAGQLITAFALSSAVVTPILAILLSRYSRKTQLIIAITIFLIGTFFTPLISDFHLLLLARVIAGIGSSFFVVISFSIAANLAKPGKQGSAMANIALGFSLAVVIGVPIGRLITAYYNWQMIFWMIGFAVLIGFFIVIVSIPHIKVDQKPSMFEQISLLKNAKILLLLGITVLMFISFSMINTYITPFLFWLAPVSEEQIGTIFLLFGIASVIGSKLGASLADKVGINPILFITIIGSIVSLIALALVPKAFIFTIAMLSLWTLFLWMFGPTQNYNLSTFHPAHASVLIGINNSFTQLGFALGAMIGGFVISLSSVQYIIHVSIITLLLAMGLFYIYKNKN
jgi:MFS transporter, DHA1 family, putative efflux transporter